MLLISLFIATLFLAYANGANDNFKGVATLFGSRTTSYQSAILWATFTTFAGSLTATYLGRTIVKEFTGKGILPDAIANAPEFHLAVAIASGLTVVLATTTGFPISTSHSLIGAMFGAGLVAFGLQVNFAILGIYFIFPLLLSPIIAIALSAGIYSLINYLNIKLNWQLNQKIIDTIHYISAGTFSFARGFNDTTKIVSLVLIIDYFSLSGAMITIAMAMGLGGLLNSQKIAETMSNKITSMNRIQGVSANIITSILVILASNFGLPISTTHVAVSSIFGVGLIGSKANKYIFYQILLVWFINLPIATIIGGITYRLLQG
ncbi:inorganic phosphate transporter [Anabaena sp. FACHB-709]|uniref:Phosphate permease n=2 Tax=Nostocaceae TaxID=1162 RepID=A0A1Z4KIB9_ANAVA|nr:MULTISPECIES: inorganic phosphate transporter [Nostocaceae]BAY68720.1 phosphate permease [Trichormus variabilis NIES-23]HBW33634.1 inorganic phosphate transporter [Nostoc sp. UBA8866]MBD2170300.1 inorganic phosphate transporter [Anabaena cylindrica FACHB-318]MBD2262220.1 inorganic phosphate transporter [Anabaena sp. FACHB-709]MBD2271633.1 inorganic phosphate transporter [Nostoc sp. PCC 7120 = FACHB-418]